MRIMQSHTSSSELSHPEGLGGPSFLLTTPGTGTGEKEGEKRRPAMRRERALGPGPPEGEIT